MQVTTAEAKRHLSELLKRVQSGERITITRYGRPVATLAPPMEELPSLAGLRERHGRTRGSALEAFLAMRNEERGEPSTSTPAS